ncbi:hypothetical protein [Acrocarpospora macrocephala]|nr:hypothetical protein [Acrocarpospora macrocephala]
MMPPQLRTPKAAAWWIVPVTLLVGGVAWWLLSAGWSVAEATATQGALQTALATGAGVGAAVTLMLAFRRQRHQEHAAHATAYLAERNADLADRNAALAEKIADNTKHDATERRVTDLYTKAAEQLGDDKAAVRLAGLYALERLAQDNPARRQTIVNVICAYLRMPYTPPYPPHDPGAPHAPGPVGRREPSRGDRPRPRGGTPGQPHCPDHPGRPPPRPAHPRPTPHRPPRRPPLLGRHAHQPDRRHPHRPRPHPLPPRTRQLPRAGVLRRPLEGRPGGRADFVMSGVDRAGYRGPGGRAPSGRKTVYPVTWPFSPFMACSGVQP